MAKSSYLAGHTQLITRPCVVHGLFNDRTGTLILEAVFCDGDHFYPSSFSLDEKQGFEDVLRDYLINEDF